MRSALRILMLLLLIGGSAAWWFREPLAEWWRLAHAPLTVEGRVIERPDPETYGLLVNEAARWRTELASRHGAAGTDEERAAVEADARLILERLLPAMMRCWLGTPWDFHGTAARPGEEPVACGYFVSTVLRDAGFQVDRFRLAQQASESILRTFLPREDCELVVGRAYERYAGELAAREPGVYLMGLDTHVAFVVVEPGGDFRFIHSSGSRPWTVVDESPAEAEVLRRSNWRMLGPMTPHPQVIRHWLAGEPLAVHGA